MRQGEKEAERRRRQEAQEEGGTSMHGKSRKWILPPGESPGEAVGGDRKQETGGGVGRKQGAGGV